ncbi:TrlF family AAA-like ATPase [Aeromonas hydrophila]|uniref:TrlF family AAA-like ATPase n=1 Tax=Aeromonas hydrophila TaxID=644 RepID=UPI0002D4D788|nr:AAA family ATPase [Aeromonas hydrophila]
MSTDNYVRGAEWRKWDLHVHTPSSIYQRFGQNDDSTWEHYINDLENLPDEFAVIGINDYLFIDGYERLLKEQQEKGRLPNLKLFPVVEFRIDKFAGIDFGSLKRINLHVIFSDDVSPETIRSQFLNTLEQSYTLNSGESWSRSITPESVADLGRTIKRDIPPEQLSKYGSDIFEGFNNLNLKEDQIYKSLEKDCFIGKYIIAIGKTEWSELKWTDSSIATKKTIINKADIVFTSSGSVEAFYKSKEQLRRQNVNDFLLDCSDAHYFSSETDKDRIGKCFTWLKADPTFEGLKQVLNEPVERVHIGDTPPLFERVLSNRTKYIKDLNIFSEHGYDDEKNIWFNNISIPLSKELTAIIGNKGSGKSAITDIISLCSNYYDSHDFSFLTPSKFRNKNGKLAKNFTAELIWESGERYTRNLNETPNNTEVLGVKYLPQGRFEKLTNEINSATEFQQEIESVVFSHIPEPERLGAYNFSELINKKTISVNLELDELYVDVKAINNSIVLLESKCTEDYKNELLSKLRKKQEELTALIKPDEVSNPNEDIEKKRLHEETSNRISKLRDSITTLENAIREAEKNKGVYNENIQIVNDIRSQVLQKEREISSFKQSISEIFKSRNITAEINTLISFNADFTELDAILEMQKNGLQQINMLLGGETNDNLPKTLIQQLQDKKNDLLIAQNGLNSEQQHYQNYLTRLHEWEKNKQLLLGTIDMPGTIAFYQAELYYLDNKLNADLEAEYNSRIDITKKIFDKKQEIINIYKSARSTLNEIIAKNSSTLKDYKIMVDASLVQVQDFNNSFLGSILQNKSGSFYSKDGAEKELTSLIGETDFDNKDDTVSFLNRIISAFKCDRRVGQNNAKRDIHQQIRNVHDLYNYLFTLSFLTNNYKLKQGDKEIEQLSPGERGALLLVFYLLLDKNDIPLIIDQPEDNLDNHSVATVLVPFIRAAKKKRQIIIVTHNPNLAIVSDAEQIVHVELDKESGYKFSTISGSIENKIINERIVKILEGDMPAFNTRKKKYYEQ